MCIRDRLRELKDTILQLNTMVSEQTELIKSLRLMIDEKSSREKALQEQVDYLTQKLFGPSSERRADDIPGQQNLFDEAEIEQDPSLLEEETVTVSYTHLIVIDLDIDKEKGKHGNETLRDWEAEQGQLPDT